MFASWSVWLVYFTLGFGFVLLLVVCSLVGWVGILLVWHVGFLCLFDVMICCLGMGLLTFGFAELALFFVCDLRHCFV